LSSTFVLNPGLSLADAQKNVAESTEIQAYFRNDQLKQIYLQGFANWSLNVTQGRITNQNPPLPPASYVVKKDADGWAYLDQTGPAVCAVPPIPEDHLTAPPAPPPMNIDIGHTADNGAGTWFDAGPNDTYPVGKKTPPMPGPPDGGVHTYLKVGGVASGNGWYEKLS
jgi:hypothetical protein